MNHTPSLDERGVIVTCPQCGRANRVAYARLGQPARCHECQAPLPMPSAPVTVDSEAAFAGLTGQDALPVLVDFWAPWCGPCKMVAPELEKVAQSASGSWIVAKVNTDEQLGISARFGIRSIPTLAVLSGGRELARQAGAMSAAGIRQFMQTVIPVS